MNLGGFPWNIAMPSPLRSHVMPRRRATHSDNVCTMSGFCVICVICVISFDT